jgi:HK97 family phage major capsid protein
VFCRINGRIQRVDPREHERALRALLTTFDKENAMASPQRNENPTLEQIAQAAQEALARMQSDQRIFTEAQRNRLKESDTRVDELQAIVQDMAQRQVSREAHARVSASSGGAYRQALTELANELHAGLGERGNVMGQLPLSIKAAALDSTEYGLPPSDQQGPVSTYAPATARLIDLLPSRKVTSGNLNFVRVDYATDSPPGNKAEVVAEGALKPESTVATLPVLLSIRTYAHWISASKQVLDDVAELKSIIDSILRGGLLDLIDQYIYQDLTTPGEHTVFTPQLMGGTPETVGDAVARISAQIAAKGGTNIVVALNPAKFLQMQLEKDSVGQYVQAPRNLAARVVAVPTIAAEKILAFAPTTGAEWADRESVNVVIGTKDDDMIRNLRTVLCEARGTTIVRNPKHVAFGNVVGIPPTS